MTCKFQVGDRGVFTKGVFKGWEVVIDRIDEPGKRLWYLIKPFEKGAVLSLELDFQAAEEFLVPLTVP